MKTKLPDPARDRSPSTTSASSSSSSSDEEEEELQRAQRAGAHQRAAPASCRAPP